MPSGIPRGKLIPERPLNMTMRRKEVCAGNDVCKRCYNFSIRGFFTDFVYQWERPELQKIPVVPLKEFNNNCSEFMMAQTLYSFNETHIYSWSFTTSMEFILYSTITARYPSTPWGKKPGMLFGGISYGPSFDQFMEYEEHILYTDRIEMVVPPFATKKLSVKSYWLPEELLIPFTAVVEFSTNPTMSCTNCTNGPPYCFQELPSSRGVLQFLKDNKFNEEILEVTDAYVKASVRGVFKGKYAERVEKVLT
ncbi:unnamed protein product [Allacma fusca]|uniref:Uncharacterized protein n=1 Tax=Allacma fusca TaxID=39272 RepID=A0A8J2PGE4_9HEXA|nr:unnamed protein product [Allacma fusca]